MSEGNASAMPSVRLAEIVCLQSRSEALERLGLAERLALLAPEADDRPLAKYQHPAPTPPCSTPTAAKLVDAWNCDRENAQVKTRIAALKPTTPASRIGENWSTWSTANLKPLKAIFLALAIWVAVAVVVVQLVPYLMKNRAVSFAESAKIRRQLGAIGTGLILLGGLLGTFGVTGVGLVSAKTLLLIAAALALISLLLFIASADRLNSLVGPTAGALFVTALALWLGSVMEVPAAQLLLPALALTVLGVLALDLSRRSSQRLRVTVDSKATEKSAADLRGIICDLGGASGARGIELPRGPDTDVLKDVDLESIAPGPWSKVVSTVLTIVKPYAPWSLRVETVTDEHLVFSLDRNYEVQDAGLFDVSPIVASMSTLGTKGDKGASMSTSLNPMAAPAAFAAIKVAQAYGQMAGFGGAKSWRGVALQYLASIRPDPYDEISKGLLARAVQVDPGNQFARLSFLLANYRHSSKADELGTLTTSLTAIIANIPHCCEKTEALELRARFAQVATLVNQTFASTPRVAPTVVSTEYVKLRKLCKKIAACASHPASALAESMEPVVDEMRASVDTVDRRTPVAGVGPKETWPDGPQAAYSRACGLMPLYGPPSDPVKVVRLLVLAGGVSTMREALSNDPQLRDLRRTKAYREQFGKPVETDFLTLEPFSTYRQTLLSLGLTDAVLLDAANPDILVANYVPEAVATRMKAIAALGCRVTGAVAPWRVPIIKFLLERHVIRPQDVTPALTKGLIEALEALESGPSNDEVRAWLERFP